MAILHGKDNKLRKNKNIINLEVHRSKKVRTYKKEQVYREKNIVISQAARKRI